MVILLLAFLIVGGYLYLGFWAGLKMISNDWTVSAVVVDVPEGSREFAVLFSTSPEIDAFLRDAPRVCSIEGTGTTLIAIIGFTGWGLNVFDAAEYFEVHRMNETADPCRASETRLAEEVRSCVIAEPRFIPLSFSDNMRMKLLSPCRALQEGLCFYGAWAHHRVDTWAQKSALAEFAGLFFVATTFMILALKGRGVAGLFLSRACACIPMAVLFFLNNYTFWDMLSWMRCRGFTKIGGFEIVAPCLFFVCWVAIGLNITMWPKRLVRPQSSRWVYSVSAIALALGEYWFFGLDSPFAKPFLWGTVTGGAICLFFAIFPAQLSQPAAET